MAQIAQQQQTTPDARAWWDGQMQQHPGIHALLSAIGAVLSFIFNGHFLVFIGRWLIRVSGYVAETSLLFAVLWISATSVGPGLIELFMPEEVMKYFVWLALIVLALIPEVILANAIVNAVKHWYEVRANHKNIAAWIWAILFTIPTLMFFVLTAITLHTLGDNGGNFVQASTTLVNWRLDAGWIYGLLALVYAGVRAFTPASVQASPAQLDYEEIMRRVQAFYEPQVQQLLTNFETQRLQLEETRKQLELTKTATLQVPFLSTKVETQNEEKRQLEEPALVDSSVSIPVDVVDDKFVDTGERETVNSQLTPRPRITVNLRATEAQQNRNTDKLKTSTTRATTAENSVVLKARTLLKKKPDMKPVELATKLKISRQYASKIKSQVLNEEVA